MAHFARLGTGSIVKKVHVVNNDTATDEQTGIDFLQTLHKTDDKFVQTSYNTYGGEHRLGGTPFRKNYARKGYTYDETKDAFISPKLFSSWALNETTCVWEAPIEKPDNDKIYDWNEENTQWDLVGS
jgi:hypothetical protein